MKTVIVHENHQHVSAVKVSHKGNITTSSCQQTFVKRCIRVMSRR